MGDELKDRPIDIAAKSLSDALKRASTFDNYVMPKGSSSPYITTSPYIMPTKMPGVSGVLDSYETGGSGVFGGDISSSFVLAELNIRLLIEIAKLKGGVNFTTNDLELLLGYALTNGYINLNEVSKIIEYTKK